MKHHKLPSTEKIVQKQIIEWLLHKGVYAWRVNSGIIPIQSGGKWRIFRGAPTGMPDILGVQKGTGRLIAIEVKDVGKHPTDIQNLMHEKLREYGALVIVAHTLEDVLKLLS